MPEQSKFENMDLFASLEAIMKQNTGFYRVRRVLCVNL